MDTQNLRAFLAVAEHASFSGAAERLHLTQPAVSKRIALLEQELGTPLFDRIGRQVGLTEAGAALLPHAESIAAAMRAAEQSVRDLSGRVSGRLRLATSHHIGLHRLPPALSRFARDFPEVQLDIDFMDSEQAYDEVMRGKFELAVITLAPESDASIVAGEIWPDPLGFMASPTHPLVRQGQLELADLAQHSAVLPGLGTYTGRIVKKLFDEARVSLDVSLATNYLETIRMLAAVGLGWTALPHSMLDDSLVALSIADEVPSRTLGYIHHRGRSLSNAARAFLEVLSLDTPTR